MAPQLVASKQRTPPTPRLVSLYELSNNRVDPFDSLPVAKNSQVESLLRYCMIATACGIDISIHCSLISCAVLTGFDLNLKTVDQRSAWFPYAIQSSATMHSTLALAAVFWYAKMPSLSPAIQQEGLNQKGKAMHQVMSHLTTGGDFAPTSVTYHFLLASIATLANVEVSLHYAP